MASIVTVRIAAEGILEAATPDYRPSITYRKAKGDVPLGELRPEASPSETTRQFRVLPGELLGEGRFNGIDVETEQTLTVQIRYDVKGDYPHQELLDFVASDAARIQAAFLRPQAQAIWSGTGLEEIIIYYAGQAGPEPTTAEGVWLVTHDFRLSYVLEA